jgi:hypothetical protein
MEPSRQHFNVSQENPTPKQEVAKPSQEAFETEEKFKYIKEDLENLFNIEVTSYASLNYPWVKDELYAKVIEDFNEGKPFALDYMFKEGLLTQEDLRVRGIQSIKPKALEAITLLKGPRFYEAKELFVNTGLLTEDEASRIEPITTH